MERTHEPIPFERFGLRVGSVSTLFGHPSFVRRLIRVEVYLCGLLKNRGPSFDI